MSCKISYFHVIGEEFSMINQDKDRAKIVVKILVDLLKTQTEITITHSTLLSKQINQWLGLK